MIGENGLAQAIIFFSNVIESWSSKLKTFAYSAGKVNDAEWRAFHGQMDEWIETLTRAVTLVGKTTKDEENATDEDKRVATKRM